MTKTAPSQIPTHESSHAKRSAAEGGRYVYIDALRGAAALAVVFTHAYTLSPVNAPLILHCPAWVTHIQIFWLTRGVHVFFVISGFVIAHSLRGTPMTPKGCGRFIYRRQIRLDPPYWIMLLLMFAATVVIDRSKGVVIPTIDRAADLLANVFYLQNILGTRDFLPVAWTLAIEIQFYLAIILILALSRRSIASKTAVTLLLLTGFAALTTNPNIAAEGHWGGHTWPYFVSGVLCYWAVRGQFSAWPMFAMLGGLLSCLYFFEPSAPIWVGVGTTLSIYVLGRMDRLKTFGNYEPLQFLGRISYSLYLTHVLVIMATQQVAYRLVKGPAGSIVWYFVTVALAVVAGYVFHRLIELPSMRLATRYKDDRGFSASTGFGEEIPPIEDIARAALRPA